MIKEIDITTLNTLCQKSKKFDGRTNALTTRALSIADCFFERKLCNIYSIQNKKGVCGVLVIYSQVATLSLFSKPDFKELCAFLSASGVARLECDRRAGVKISKILSLERLDGDILYVNRISRYSGDFEIEKSDDIKRLFSILKEGNPSYKNTAYEAFYCDAFYRQKLPSQFYILSHNHIDCACATVMHRYKNTAILSDVTVLPEMRRRGLASAIVSRACIDLLKSGFHPVLFRTAKEAKGLYKKLKFQRESKFSVVIFC